MTTETRQLVGWILVVVTVTDLAELGMTGNPGRQQ